MTEQPNLELVKKEVPETNDTPLLQHEVLKIKSESVSTDIKLESSSPDTTQEEVGVNSSLELKSEIFDGDCYEENDETISIKKELLQEELDIKCEDETVQEPHIDDYNLVNVVNPFKCNICDYSGCSKNGLYSHLRMHPGKYPFKCKGCDFKSKRKRDLQTHLRTHTIEKPFKCNMCHCSYKQNSHLQNHLRTHTGEMSFKCNICNYSCRRKSTLRSHLMTHTGEKPFECHMCDYSCRQRTRLQNHLRTHTGEKPFKCHICKKMFRAKSSLRSHSTTHSEKKLL